MINEIFTDTKHKMVKSIEYHRSEVFKIRTGRASTNMLDSLKVDYYGSPTPLNTIAHLTVPESQLIIIQPFDPSSLETIERSIIASDLGLNPNNDGHVIRLSIPSLTEERRRELVKVVHNIIEDGKVSIRNIRRDANDHLKSLEKTHDISEDNLRRALENIQDMTNEYIDILVKMQESKEKEILE